MSNILPCSYISLYFGDNNAFKINSMFVAVVNIIAAIPTIVLNFLIIITFWKKASLRTYSNKLLLNLSMSDFLSGLIVQPLIAVILIIAYVGESSDVPCVMIAISSVFGYTVACVSLLTVSLISLERYMAIFYPFMHSRFISARLLIVVCFSVWILSSTLVFGLLLSEQNVVFFWINAIIIAFTYIWNIWVYIKITRQIWKLRHEVTRMQQRFEIENTSKSKYSKGTRIAGAIILALLLCYLPQVFVSLWRLFSSKSDFIDAYVEYWSISFGLFNPGLNPLFYCYYNSDIRKVVFSLLCLSKFRGRRLDGHITPATYCSANSRIYSSNQPDIGYVVKGNIDMRKYET